MSDSLLHNTALSESDYPVWKNKSGMTQKQMFKKMAKYLNNKNGTRRRLRTRKSSWGTHGAYLQ